MTEAFEEVRQRPQTGYTRDDFSYDERSDLEWIRISRSTDSFTTQTSGWFSSVVYVVGDEKRAAEVFVEENHEYLEEIDFSQQNLIKSCVSQVVYDWILDAMGERELRKYETVVYERRRDGTEWFVERDQYERRPNRRYSVGSKETAKIVPEDTAQEIYDRLGDVITASELNGIKTVEGDGRQVLDYYRLAGGYDCVPTSVDGELAIEKRSQ